MEFNLETWLWEQSIDSEWNKIFAQAKGSLVTLNTESSIDAFAPVSE